MKKYKNFIIGMIVSGLIGGMIGGFSDELSLINLTFNGNINDYIFKIFFGISSIIVVYIVTTLICIRKDYKKIDLDDIPKNIERKITNAIHYSTVQVILGLIWDAVVINKNFDSKLLYLILVPTAFIFIGGGLLNLTMKYYNYIYPNRKLYLYENKAGEKYFQKLDEGEKWIAYNCSYSTFVKMQIVYSAVIVLCMLLSLFTNVPMILPIVVGIIWIIEISIYSHESKKYVEK